MAAIAGYIFHKKSGENNKLRIAIAAACGQLAYILLYLSKTYIENYFILGLTREATMVEIVQKAGVSLTNGVISIIFATILAIPLLKAVKFE